MKQSTRRLILAILALIILWNIGIIVKDELCKVGIMLPEQKQQEHLEKEIVLKKATETITSSAIDINELLALEEPEPEPEPLAIMEVKKLLDLKEEPKKTTLELIEDIKLRSQQAMSTRKLLVLDEQSKQEKPKAAKEPQTTTPSAIKMEEKLPVKKVKKPKKEKKVTKKKAKRVKRYIGGANWVNFRNAPNLESEVKEVLKRGTKLEIISKKKNWSKVELESGKKGYVYNKYLTKNKEEFVEEEKKYFCGVELQYSATYNICDNPLNRQNGVVNYGGHIEKYYPQRVLSGGGLDIPGRHVAEDGTIRDSDGYICVASDLTFMARGSLLMTSLGPAKVYDTGCPYEIIDIYVNW